MRYSISFTLVLAVLILSLSACHGKISNQSNKVSEGITKKYYVDGMTCGGCETGVKIMLKKQGFGKNISSVSYENAEAILIFQKDEYTPKTDCKVIKAIKGQFVAYLDPTNKKPCPEKE